MLRRLLLLVGAAAWIAACASLPPPEPRPLGDEEARLLREVAGAAREGAARGEMAARAALAVRPESVDLARALQNMRLARGETWEVYEDALAACAERPEDPGRLYLLGRSIPDRVERRRLFERARSLDPSLFWASFGLAVVALDAEDPEGAAEHARRALAIRPGDPDTRLLLGKALAAAGRREEAETLYAGLLLEDPENAGAALAGADLLARTGHEPEALELVLRAITRQPENEDLRIRAWELADRDGIPGEQLGRVAAAPAATGPAGDLLLGRARLRRGEHREALAALDRAVAAGARASAVKTDLLGAALGAERYDRAREILLSGWPAELREDAGNERGPALERLLAALERAARGAPGPEELAELARALSGAGFAVEAADFAARAARLAPDSGAAALEADLARWRDFLVAVRRGLRERYRAFSVDGREDGLAETLADLGGISVRYLGRDVVGGMPVDSWPFAGSVARSDAPGAPPDFTAHGTLFVVGRRSSGPVEATMMRLVGRFPERDDGEGPYALAVGEGQTLRSYFEEGAGRIAGFTLPGWVLLNLDVVNRWEEEVRSLASRAPGGRLWPAPDRRRRTSLWFPGPVRGGLARRYVEAAGPANGSLDSALAHERGHLRDTHRYLPLLPHLPAVLGLLIADGFRTSAIEETLEENAETWALAVSRWPRNALLNTMAFLPWSDSAPPHSRAYGRILGKVVDEIASHPGDYPSVDREANVLQQLDRLTDEEIRRALQRGLDLPTSASISRRAFGAPAESTSAPSSVTSTVSSMRMPKPSASR